MKRIILLITLLLVLTACGDETVQDTKPTCEKPYILVGQGCCLDENDNKVCDKDEEKVPVETEGDTITVKPEEPVHLGGDFIPTQITERAKITLDKVDFESKSFDWGQVKTIKMTIHNNKGGALKPKIGIYLNNMPHETIVLEETIPTGYKITKTLPVSVSVRQSPYKLMIKLFDTDSKVMLDSETKLIRMGRDDGEVIG